MNNSLLQTTSIKFPKPEKYNNGFFQGSIKYAGQQIDQKHSPRRLARAILKHNSKTRFTPCLWIGQSGTGKSISMTTQAHHVHEIASKELGINFTVKWMPPKSLVNIEHVFETLPKQPTILIFDDVSDELEEYPPAVKKKVFKALTTVRHVVDAPIIVFSAVHYSKAMEKRLRNVPYVVLTSVSDEEYTNIDQLWGYRQTEKIKQFFKKFEACMEKDVFTMDVNGNEREFVPDNPFRPLLVKRIRECHFILNDKRSCHICKNHEEDNQKEDIAPERFYAEFLKSYNQRANNVLMYWLYINGVPTALADDYRTAWNKLSKMFNKYKVDKMALAQVLKNNRGTHKKENRGRKKILKGFENDLFTTFQNTVREEEQLKKLNSMPNNTL